MEDSTIAIMLGVNIPTLEKVIAGLRLLQAKEPSPKLADLIERMVGVLNEAIFRDALHEIGKILEDPKKCEDCDKKETCFPKVCMN